jgi:hypothetical protein
MTPWAVGLASIAVIALVMIPLWGYRKFNPKRARQVKFAEQDDVAIIVQKRVVALAVHHPEIVKQNRFDRHPFYVAPHVGVFSYAVCVFSGATVTNNVAVLSPLTRVTMATCFIVGACFVLAGTLGGAKIGRWTIGRRVVDHPTSPLLGDDITLPYWLGILGLCCVTVSMAIYSSTSFKTTTGSLGGWLTATLAGASAAGIVHLFLLVKEFERNEAVLVAEVMARLERDHDLD